MKKLIFIFLMLFFLTGCNNSVEFDFKEDVDTKINLSFTLDEYRMYSKEEDLNDEELKSALEGIRNDMEVFSRGNCDTFIEKSYVNNGNYYSGIYEYTYTYSNFKDNSILNTCFEYFGVKEDEDNIYVSLKGESMCAPFKLVIKADNRMVSSNQNIKNGNEYIWNIQELNNDVYMTISKTKIDSSSFNVLNLIYIIVAIIIGVGAFILNKKFKESK